MKILSGYRLMWMMVLYDLPVVDHRDRKQAKIFHDYLLDEGFMMAQYSVYLKFLDGSEAAEVQKNRIERELPEGGKVDILCFTDKQYENIVRYQRRARQKKNQNPEQLLLL